LNFDPFFSQNWVGQFSPKFNTETPIDGENLRKIYFADFEIWHF